MIIGVDGTGSYIGSGDFADSIQRFFGNDSAWEPTDYHVAFVRNIVTYSKEPCRRYIRGPASCGLDCRALTDQVLEAVKEFLPRDNRRGIFLTGYSRGAAICVQAARDIIQLGHEVKALFLFDAVDRSIQIDGDPIPYNVRNVYHAFRDPKAGSRDWFGNCATQTEGPATQLIKKMFFATHSGMGGMPWGGDHPVERVLSPTAEQQADKQRYFIESVNPRTGYVSWGRFMIIKSEDIAGAAAVKAWMWANLANHGVI